MPFRSYYSRPYYAFRPRASLAFGLVVGYPVAFPYDAYAYSYPYAYASAYPVPYSYPAPYAYPSPSSSGYPYAPSAPPYAVPGPAVEPGPSAEAPAAGALQDLGGLSFDITPGDAQVLVDGQPVGVVSTFSRRSQPLTLAPGHHRVEIRAPGYRAVTFEVDLTPGEVIPYYGALER